MVRLDHVWSEKDRLTHAEEIYFNKLVKNGDAEAREIFIVCNQRLVRKIATKLTQPHIEHDDLVNEGNFGLIHATDTYDCEFGTRFGTFASYWIRQTMRRQVLHRGVARITDHAERLYSRWVATENHFMRLGIRPDVRTIADHLRLTPQELMHVQRAMSLLRLEGEEPDVTEATDREYDERTFNEADIARLRKTYHHLGEHEWEVLSLRYGLSGRDPMTQQEIADTLQLTRKAVQIVETRVLDRLATLY